MVRSGESTHQLCEVMTSGKSVLRSGRSTHESNKLLCKSSKSTHEIRTGKSHMGYGKSISKSGMNQT